LVEHGVLRVEKTVHLQQDILRNSDKLTHRVQELVKDG
jgi:hypothetical protein